MPIQKNVPVDGAEQGALHQIIEAAAQINTPELRRVLALPSVREDVEGRPQRLDLYDAIDVEALAEQAEVESISGYDVRGDSHVGYFVTFAVLDDEGVSRGFFPLDEVKLKPVETAEAPAATPQAPPTPPAPVESGPKPDLPDSIDEDEYASLNQASVLERLAQLTPEDVAKVQAYEAARQDRKKIREYEPPAPNGD